MEIIQEGRNFRLIQDSELSDVLVILDQYLPESVKVINIPSLRQVSLYNCSVLIVLRMPNEKIS